MEIATQSEDHSLISQVNSLPSSYTLRSNTTSPLLLGYRILLLRRRDSLLLLLPQRWHPPPKPLPTTPPSTTLPLLEHHCYIPVHCHHRILGAYIQRRALQKLLSRVEQRLRTWSELVVCTLRIVYHPHQPSTLGTSDLFDYYSLWIFGSRIRYPRYTRILRLQLPQSISEGHGRWRERRRVGNWGCNWCMLRHRSRYHHHFLPQQGTGHFEEVGCGEKDG